MVTIMPDPKEASDILNDQLKAMGVEPTDEKMNKPGIEVLNDVDIVEDEDGNFEAKGKSVHFLDDPSPENVKALGDSVKDEIAKKFDIDPDDISISTHQVDVDEDEQITKLIEQLSNAKALKEEEIIEQIKSLKGSESLYDKAVEKACLAIADAFVDSENHPKENAILAQKYSKGTNIPKTLSDDRARKLSKMGIISEIVKDCEDYGSCMFDADSNPILAMAKHIAIHEYVTKIIVTCKNSDLPDDLIKGPDELFDIAREEAKITKEFLSRHVISAAIAQYLNISDAIEEMSEGDVVLARKLDEVHKILRESGLFKEVGDE